MPKQGGAGKGKPKKADIKGFGKALIRMHQQGQSTKLKAKHSQNMIGILDDNNLEDFIETAEMDGEAFEVQRVHQNHAFLTQVTTHKSQSLTFSAFDHEQLAIPRKPAWTRDMTAEEVDRNEKQAFLRWRREIAAIESNDNYTKKVTPFEKNIEVWRQLWRVCERSDLMIQIVDARNPLLFFTKDLMQYVSEMEPPRQVILLLNKADFLTEFQRQVWADYLTGQGVRFAFYSAHMEQGKLDAAQDSQDGAHNNDAAHTGKMSMSESELKQLAKDMSSAWYIGEGDGEGGGGEEGDDYNDEVDDDDDERDEAHGSDDGVDNGDDAHDQQDITHDNELEEQDAKGAAESYEDESKDEQEPKEPEEPNEQEDQDEGEDEDEEEEDDLEQYMKIVSRGKKVEKLSTNGFVPPAASDVHIPAQVVATNGDNNPNLTKTTNKGAGTSTSSHRDHHHHHNHRGRRRREARARILTRTELLRLLQLVAEELQLEAQARHDYRVCVGLVGYPNVGKSSVINTLMGVSKTSHGKVRVAVSSTPGKTKHFQTLILPDELNLMLCDCPGLVFPSFMRSTGEMLCAGILPINHMRDYTEPANVLAARVPQYLLEAALGIRIHRHLDALDAPDRPPTPTEMLSAYCSSRGYITGSTGRWDEFRACKDLLSWFTSGKLLYVNIPPDLLAAEEEEEEAAAAATLAPKNASVPALGPGGEGAVATSKLSAFQQRWIKETERVLVRRQRVAERVISQHQATLALMKGGAAAGGGGGATSGQLAKMEEKAAVQAALEAGLFVHGEDHEEDSEHEDDEKVNAHHGSDMVFDYATPAVAVQRDANGYEFVDDDDDDDDFEDEEDDDTRGERTSSVTTRTNDTVSNSTKRQHKRLKNWGKKNRKLRSRDPYGEDAVSTANLVAYSTNRHLVQTSTGAGAGASGGSTDISKGNKKLVRHGVKQQYGTQFVRTILPHHQNSSKQQL